MRVAALVQELGGASARLRVVQIVGELEQLGVAVEVCEVARAGPARWRQLASLRGFDAIWWQRRLIAPWESALLRARARRLVVDLDDAVWRRDRAPFGSALRRWRARALLRRADALIVGSRSLALELGELALGPAREPIVVASAVRAAPNMRAPSRVPTLVWCGQPSTWRYVERFLAAWPKVRAACPGARFVVVGGPRALVARDGIEPRAWSVAAEAEALAEGWLGLAPLPDDPWTRGKCGARSIACLAAGLPALTSRVGAQAEWADAYGGSIEWPQGSDGALEVIGALRGGAPPPRCLDAARRLARERSPARTARRMAALLRGDDEAAPEARRVARATPQG